MNRKIVWNRTQNILWSITYAQMRPSYIFRNTIWCRTLATWSPGYTQSTGSSVNTGNPDNTSNPRTASLGWPLFTGVTFSQLVMLKGAANFFVYIRNDQKLIQTSVWIHLTQTYIWKKPNWYFAMFRQLLDSWCFLFFVWFPLFGVRLTKSFVLYHWLVLHVSYSVTSRGTSLSLSALELIILARKKNTWLPHNTSGMW